MDDSRYIANTEEKELLVVVSEELSESIAAAQKIVRFGFGKVKDAPFSKKEALEQELGQVLAAMTLLVRANIIDAAEVLKHEAMKLYMYEHGNVLLEQNPKFLKDLVVGFFPNNENVSV